MSYTAAAERCRGLLLGLVAGDRNGGPSRMALRVAASLLERHSFDRDDLARRYVDWWRSGAFDTGPTTARALGLLAEGVPLTEAAARVHAETGGRTAGCNPAHRCGPLAMAAFLADDGLAQAALIEAAITHFDPLAGEVAAAVVILCRALIRGYPWEVAVRRAAAASSRTVRSALATADDGPGTRGGYAPEVLCAAVHFVAGAEDFSASLAAALRFAGPANYCPLLVGAIAGARWGAPGIPEGALHHAMSKDILPYARQLAGALAAGWSERP